MRIDEAAKIAVDTARAVLEDMVRTSKGAWNFGTMIVCYRGQDPVAMLVTPPNRATLLEVAHLAARGFGPDLMALSHDTYIAVAPLAEAKDPRTGKPWGRPNGDEPGPLQTYVDEFGYDGTVSDCLVTHVVNRAGDATVQPHPYEVAGRQVKWLDFIPDRAVYSDEGVQAALRQMMGMTTLAQVLPGKMPAWAVELANSDPERTRWVYDMVTASVVGNEISGDIGVALFAERGSPRDQMFRKRFPRSQIIDPRRWN